MAYNSLVELIRLKCLDAKSNLFFGVGTDKELNANEKANFPLVWIRQPVQVSKIQNTNKIIIQEKFSFTLRVLQTTSLQTTQEQNNKLFDETNYILNAILNDLLEKEVDLLPGFATQVFLKTDLVLIGWDMPIGLTTEIDSDICCSFFNT